MELTEETKKEWKIVSKNKYTKQIIKYIKHIFIMFIIIFFCAYHYSKNILINLLNYYGVTTQIIGVTEDMSMKILFSLIFSTIFILPIILIFVYSFFEQKNNKHIRRIWYSFILALCGIFLGFTIMTKKVIVGLTSDTITKVELSLEKILTFGMGISWVTALSLQLIILIPLLSEWGIINTKKYNKYVAFTLFALTAVICVILTPADIVSTLITMIPMNLSVFLGVKLSKHNNKCEEK